MVRPKPKSMERHMFGTALMATDLSPASQAMVRCAHALEPLGVRKILLLHALGLRHLKDMAPRLREEVEPRIAEQEAGLRAQGFEVEKAVVPGLPSQEILEASRAGEVSLLVMAATGDIPRAIVLGSVTCHVLHEATRPVLVLHLRPADGEDGEVAERCEVICTDLLGHVVYGTDFSDTAERAFRVLEALAPLGVDRVTLVHVQDHARLREGDRERLEEFDRIDRGRLERLRDDLEHHGVTQVDIEIPFGSPVREIVALTRDEDVTMVLLGTQGRGFFGELLLGGVAHKVARRASVPTLLVPPKIEEVEEAAPSR